MPEAQDPIKTAQENTVQVPKTWAEIEATIKSIGRDAGKEGAAEMLVEEMKKFQKQQARTPEKDKALGFMKALNQDKSVMGKGRVSGLNIMPGFEKADELTGTGLKAAAALPLMLRAKREGGKPEDYAKNAGNDHVAKMFTKAAEGAQTASDFTSGGFMIPEEVSADVIAYLYNTSAVRRLGARIIPMARGNLSMNKINETLNAYWIGETNRIMTSKIQGGRIAMSAKKLGISVGISNDLIRFADGSVIQIIHDDMTRAARTTEDQALIRGRGTNYRPSSIDELMSDTNKVQANASNAFADIVQDLFKLQYLVDGREFELDAISPGFILSKRDAYFLKSLISTDGTFIFLPQMMQGLLIDAPYAATNNIPSNLGAGSDESEIYYGDFSQLLIGQSLDVTMQKWEGASWVDSNGNTVHGAQQDMTLETLVIEEDSAVRHDSAFSKLEGVDWSSEFLAA